VLDTDDLVTQIHGTGVARSLPEKIEKGMSVEPAFTTLPVSTGGDILDIEPGKPLLEAVGIEQGDIGAFGSLRAPVLLEDRFARCACKQQIAAFVKADIGPGTKPLLEGAHDLQPKQAHADILRGRELLSDRSGRKGGRGEGIGRVAFDHRDRAGVAQHRL
jgi:hypothetical protein